MTRWPDRWYEVSKGCDALDMVALLILEIDEVVIIRRDGDTVTFGGGGRETWVKGLSRYML